MISWAGDLLRSWELAAWDVGSSWTPKVCKIMAFMAIIMGLGPLFYILLGLGCGFLVFRGVGDPVAVFRSSASDAQGYCRDFRLIAPL